VADLPAALFRLDGHIAHAQFMWSFYRHMDPAAADQAIFFHGDRVDRFRMHARIVIAVPLRAPAQTGRLAEDSPALVMYILQLRGFRDLDFRSDDS
jgi:hypothetical protein